MSNQVLMEFATKFLGLIILSTVLSIALKVLTMLAIYFDAKAIALKNKTVYIVLAFFFPLIVGIVYLCTRKTAIKEVPKICNICNTTVAPEFTHCPNCGGVSFTDYLVMNNEKYKKIAKNLLIAAIIVCIASVAATVTSQIECMRFVDRFDDYSDGNDYFGDYGNDIEKFFKEYNGDNDDSADDDSDYSDNPFSDFGTEDDEDDYQDDSDSSHAEDFNNFGN